MQAGGVPVPDFEIIASGEGAGSTSPAASLAAAVASAERLGFPVVLRPHGQAHGKGARVVADPAAMSRAVADVQAVDRTFLVQRWVRGTHYRVCVLDGRVVCGFEPIPMTVCGDGIHSIGELIASGRAGLPAMLGFASRPVDEGAIDGFLAAWGRSRLEVPARGELVAVALGTDPETEARVHDARGRLSDAALEIARKAANCSGLRLAAVDGVVPDDSGPVEFWVLQVDGFCDLSAYDGLGEGPHRAVTALVSECLEERRPLEASLPSTRDAEPADGAGDLGRPAELPGLTTLAARVAEIAPAMGIGVYRVPDHLDAVRLTYPDGRIRHVIDEMTDLNDPASVAVARQKAWSAGFLQKGGFRVPEFECFYADWLAQVLGTDRNEAAALSYAEQLGFPVVCKPSAGMAGKGVFVAAGAADFARFCSTAAATEPIFLVQRAVSGLEYRIVVLDGELQLAYEKHPLTIVGDGESSIDELIGRRLDAIRSDEGHVEITPDDFRITAHLAFLGRSRRDVPERGEQLRVMLNAGYGCGGYLVEARQTVSANLVETAIGAAAQLGLRYAGIDIKGSEGPGGAPYHLLEVNSMPDLSGYAALGPAQRQHVEGLIERLIAAMGRSRHPRAR